MNKFTALVKKHKYVAIVVITVLVVAIGGLVAWRALTPRHVFEIPEFAPRQEFPPIDPLVLQRQAEDILSFFDQTINANGLYSTGLECAVNFDNPYQQQLGLAVECTPYNRSPLGGLSLTWARSLAYTNFGNSDNVYFLLEDLSSYLNAVSGATPSASLQNSDGFICVYMENIWNNVLLNEETRDSAREICLMSSQISSIPTLNAIDISLDSSELEEEILPPARTGNPPSPPQQNEVIRVVSLEENLRITAGGQSRSVYEFLADADTLAYNLTNNENLDSRFIQMLQNVDNYFNQPLLTYARRLAESSIKYGLTGDQELRREAEFNFGIVITKHWLLQSQNEFTAGDQCLIGMALGAYINNIIPSTTQSVFFESMQNEIGIVDRIANDDIASMGFCSLARDHINIDRERLSQKITNAHQSQTERLFLDRTPIPFINTTVNRSAMGESWLINTELNGQLIGGMMLVW
ncbi:MAG: hypothetical protein LBG64_03490 [Pseudomonadales bacterium]|jgi:hypothetical protein|nr:hypothetical protein [Pseudomonadales bacterium]